MANRNRIFGVKPRQQNNDFYEIENTMAEQKTETTKRILSEQYTSKNKEKRPQCQDQQQYQYDQHRSRPTIRTIRNNLQNVSNPSDILSQQQFQFGNHTFLGQIERERSKSQGRSKSRGRSQSANGGYRSISKGRREKFLPPKKDDTELFDENQLIKQGKFANAIEDVVVQNQDGKCPKIEKLENFSDCCLSKEILSNLKLKHCNKPTPVQKVVIPIIQNTQSDLIVHAPTGCGKTAAFLLPIINELQNEVGNHFYNETHGNRPYVIIMSPTKELAEQLANDARAFAMQTGVTVAHTYGDIPMRPTLINLAAGCDIFVSTCGRLQQFVEDGHILLTKLRYFILDEADKLLKVFDFNHCINLIKSHPDIKPEHRVLMFSATYEPELVTVAEKFLEDSNFMLVKVEQSYTNNSTPISLNQKFLKVRLRVDEGKNELSKEDTLLDFLLTHKSTRLTHDSDLDEDYFKVPKTIVFVEKKRAAYRLAMSIRHNNIRAMGVNSTFTLKMRWDAVNKFASNEIDVLVSTDVLARGMNFPGLQYVINYDLPSRDPRGTQDEYIHRIGRTGRMGNYGDAISYFDPDREVDLRNASYYVKVLTDSGEEVPNWLREIADEKQKQIMEMDRKSTSGSSGGAEDKHSDDPYFLGNKVGQKKSQNKDGPQQNNDNVRVQTGTQKSQITGYREPETPQEQLEKLTVDNGW